MNLHLRGVYFGLATALSACAGAQVGPDKELNDPGWKPFQDSYLTYRSKGRLYAMAVHFLCGDQRMGVLKIDVAPRKGGGAKRIYADIRSWNWCTLAYADRTGEPFLLVDGYWDVISPVETTFFKLRGDRLIPFPEGARSATLRSLRSACSAYMTKRNERCCIEAHRVNGAWILKKARTLPTRHLSPKPTVLPSHR